MHINHPHKNSSIKVIGNNGQISLGKEYAGQQVVVELSEPGVWLIQVIPENELWIHQPNSQEDLNTAFNWATKSVSKASVPTSIIKKLEHEKKSRRK